MREHLQQDKESAIYDVAKMFSDFGVPYVISGGIAVQLYVQAGDVRSTGDVDVVSLRDRFKELKISEPWSRYGLELIFDRRRYVKLRHIQANVDVDINLDTRFARMLAAPTTEQVRGLGVAFTSPMSIAFAKLRTQRQDWPRDPAKRLQDRADVIRLIRNHPEIVENLRQDADMTEEMRVILTAVERDAGSNARRRGQPPPT